MDKYDELNWKRLIVMYSQLMYEINIIKKKMSNIKKNIEPVDFELGFELDFKMLDVEEIFVDLEEMLNRESINPRLK